MNQTQQLEANVSTRATELYDELDSDEAAQSLATDLLHLAGGFNAHSFPARLTIGDRALKIGLHPDGLRGDYLERLTVEPIDESSIGLYSPDYDPYITLSWYDESVFNNGSPEASPEGTDQ